MCSVLHLVVYFDKFVAVSNKLIAKHLYLFRNRSFTEQIIHDFFEIFFIWITCVHRTRILLPSSNWLLQLKHDWNESFYFLCNSNFRDSDKMRWLINRAQTGCMGVSLTVSWEPLGFMSFNLSLSSRCLNLATGLENKLWTSKSLRLKTIYYLCVPHHCLRLL